MSGHVADGGLIRVWTARHLIISRWGGDARIKIPVELDVLSAGFIILTAR